MTLFHPLVGGGGLVHHGAAVACRAKNPATCRIHGGKGAAPAATPASKNATPPAASQTASPAAPPSPKVQLPPRPPGTKAAAPLSAPKVHGRTVEGKAITGGALPKPGRLPGQTPESAPADSKKAKAAARVPATHATEGAKPKHDKGHDSSSGHEGGGGHAGKSHEGGSHEGGLFKGLEGGANTLGKFGRLISEAKHLGSEAVQSSTGSEIAVSQGLNARGGHHFSGISHETHGKRMVR